MDWTAYQDRYGVRIQNIMAELLSGKDSPSIAEIQAAADEATAWVHQGR